MTPVLFRRNVFGVAEKKDMNQGSVWRREKHKIPSQ